MTTAIRHPQLDSKERAALATLGVPLDDPNLVIDISWSDTWRSEPCHWAAAYGIETLADARNWTESALEHGPEEVAETVHFEDVGTLDQLATALPKILTMNGLDEAEDVNLEICGWALWAAGHLA